MKNGYGYFGAVVMGLVLAGGLTAAATAPATAARVVKLSTDDAMKYDVTMIQAKPGEMLEVQLTSKGSLPKIAMAHNFVLLTKKADANAFVMEAAMSKATDYIPAKYKADIIASTPLAGPGETVKVTFAAPKVAGSYVYLCSFAGHYLTGMKGTLLVK